MGSSLNITPTDFNGLFVIEPNTHKDKRGFFSRIYCIDELKEITNMNIKQINHSFTNKKGTIRGMHFQYEPDSEVKIIKCISGGILDVVIDIRENSPTFLKNYTIELTKENQKMLYIPKGFAHGFQTLEDNTELIYFHSNIYTPDNEGALNIKDSLLDLKWPLDIVNISKRDKEHKFLESNFKGIVVNEL